MELFKKINEEVQAVFFTKIVVESKIGEKDDLLLHSSQFEKKILMPLFQYDGVVCREEFFHPYVLLKMDWKNF